MRSQNDLDWFAARLAIAVYDTNQEYRMSITGAKFLGSQFKDQLAQVKAKLSQATDDMGGAMQELQDVADHAAETVQAVRAETAELKAALGLVSNNPPADAPIATATPLPAVELNAAGVVPEAQ